MQFLESIMPQLPELFGPQVMRVFMAIRGLQGRRAPDFSTPRPERQEKTVGNLRRARIGWVVPGCRRKTPRSMQQSLSPPHNEGKPRCSN